MAQLSDTIVTGRLAVTGHIYENGEDINKKFASVLAFDTSTKTFSLKNSYGTTLSSITLPGGVVTINAASISISTSSPSLNSTTHKYTFSGSTTPGKVVTTTGWISNTSSINVNAVSASIVLDQSYIIFRQNNSGSDSTSYDTTIGNVDPGTTLYVKAGYYPSDRTITITKANTSGESESGSITLKSTLGGSILKDSNAGDDYVITGTAAPNTFNGGWINTAPSNATSTKYITKGVITNNLTSLPSGATSTDTISSGNVIKIASGYYNSDIYYTAQTAAAAASGNIELTQPTSTNVASYATATVKTGVAGAITGGTLSGGAPSVQNKDLSGSNITLGDTNNGISVTMSAKARRAAVTRAAASYSITTAGWISSAGSGLSADSTTLPQTDSAADTLTKYVSALTVPSSKTLPTITLAGGTVTNLALSANSTITNLKGDNTTRTLTVGSVSSDMLLVLNGNAGGEVRLTNSAAGGKLLFKDYTAYSNSGSYLTLTDGTTGNLKKSNFSAGSYTGSGTQNFAHDMSLTNNFTGGPTTYKTTQPSSGFYLTIGIDSHTYSGVNVTSGSNGITEGWLNAISANTALGSSTLTVNSTTKYIELAGATITPSVVDFVRTNSTSVVTSSLDTGYKVVASAKAKSTISSSGWVRATTDDATSGASTLTVNIQKANITLGGSVTSAPSVSLSVAGTDGYNMTTTQPGTTSNYITVTATNTNTSGTVTATNTVSTEGYAKNVKSGSSGEVDGSKAITVSTTGDASTTKTVWIPKVTPSFDGGAVTGGGLSQGTPSGGVLSGGTPSVIDKHITGTNVDFAGSENGIKVTMSAKATRTAVTATKFSKTVSRAAVARADVLYNGAAKGAINVANNTVALAGHATAIEADSTTVEFTASSLTAATSSADTLDAYIEGVTVPSATTFTVANNGITNITENKGTVRYENCWIISRDDNHNLVFNFSPM